MPKLAGSTPSRYPSPPRAASNVSHAAAAPSATAPVVLSPPCAGVRSRQQARVVATKKTMMPGRYTPRSVAKLAWRPNKLTIQATARPGNRATTLDDKETAKIAGNLLLVRLESLPRTPALVLRLARLATQPAQRVASRAPVKSANGPTSSIGTLKPIVKTGTEPTIPPTTVAMGTPINHRVRPNY